MSCIFNFVIEGDFMTNDEKGENLLTKLYECFVDEKFINMNFEKIDNIFSLSKRNFCLIEIVCIDLKSDNDNNIIKVTIRCQ